MLVLNAIVFKQIPGLQKKKNYKMPFYSVVPLWNIKSLEYSTLPTNTKLIPKAPRKKN